MVPDLDRIRLLCDLLGSPQQAYPSIHLTGTNGKTSTARMIDALRARASACARAATPARTSTPSPSGSCIDGDPLSRRAVRRGLRRGDARTSSWSTRGLPVPMTFFEVLTGMAFAAFADAPVDVAVLEVGPRRAVGRDQRRRGRDLRRPARRPRPRAAARARRSTEIADREGRDHPRGRHRRARRAADRRPPRCCCAAAPRSAPPSRAKGSSSASSTGRPPSGVSC